ncbi:MAG: hypothetical protein DRJ57_03490 [Thermoprotei archaeon]|nr:MAG: hypothetical protein DRJ57_03490 [Thermoprotei archaeon]
MSVRKAFLRAQLAILAGTGVLGGGGALLLHMSGVAELLEGPFIKEEGVAPALLNSLLFIALLLGGALLMLLLAKLRLTFLKLVGSAALSMASFLVGEVYAYAIRLQPLAADALSVTLAVATLYLTLMRPSNPASALLQVAVGSLLGPILASMAAPTSLLLMLLAAALYDVYAVHRGPLKHLLKEVLKTQGPADAGTGPSPLAPLTVNFGGVVIGMGDVILYSSMGALALLSPRLDFLRFAIVLLSMLIGVHATLKLLEKRRYVAALPIPLSLSLATYLSYNLLSAWLGA